MFTTQRGPWWPLARVAKGGLASHVTFTQGHIIAKCLAPPFDLRLGVTEYFGLEGTFFAYGLIEIFSLIILQSIILVKDMRETQQSSLLDFQATPKRNHNCSTSVLARGDRGLILQLNGLGGLQATSARNYIVKSL